MAASVGPYGAALGDGSEYRGDYGLSVAQLRRWHRFGIQVLADVGPDVLALETVPCLTEAEALLEEVRGLSRPCWLSMTCVGDRTRAGEPVAEAFAMAAEVDEVVAVGVNCLDPADTPALVALATAVSGKPAVVYPNAGERWDADGAALDGGPGGGRRLRRRLAGRRRRARRRVLPGRSGRDQRGRRGRRSARARLPPRSEPAARGRTRAHSRSTPGCDAPHTFATHPRSMTIIQLALVAATVLGILVVALAAVVPDVMDLADAA